MTAPAPGLTRADFVILPQPPAATASDAATSNSVFFMSRPPADARMRRRGGRCNRARKRVAAPQNFPWQALYLRPDPQGQGALRGTVPQVSGLVTSTPCARAIPVIVPIPAEALRRPRSRAAASAIATSFSPV